MTYKIISGNSEKQRGENFGVEPSALESGHLYLFKVGSCFIVGRWLPGWILQPRHWIDLENNEIRVLGRVEPV